jgi:hypothetical protein
MEAGASHAQLARIRNTIRSAKGPNGQLDLQKTLLGDFANYP